MSLFSPKIHVGFGGTRNAWVENDRARIITPKPVEPVESHWSLRRIIAPNPPNPPEAASRGSG